MTTLLWPIQTPSGIPTATAQITATKVMIRVSIEST